MTRSPKKSAPRSSSRRVPSGPSSARSMRNLAASTSVATPSLSRAANEAHDMANATEALGPKTDAYKLFMLIPTGGDRVGNISLRRQLGWNEAKYAAAKDRLLESGLVQKDMGKGGSLRRTKRDALAQSLSFDTQGRVTDGAHRVAAAVAIAPPAASPLVVPAAKLVVKAKDKGEIKRTYKPAASAEISKKAATAVGSVIEELLATGRTEVKPRDLLTAARSKKSPIHGLFNWDDKAAAEEYRLSQASSLLYSVVVEIVPVAPAKVIQPTIRTAAPLLPSRGPATRSAPTPVDYKEQMVKNAIRKLESWAAEYGDLERRVGFKPVFAAIRALKRS